MSVKSGFYNSINGDRVYNADDLNNFLNGLISDGLFRDYQKEMQVEASGDGLSVRVLSGKAIIKGKYIENTSALTIDIPAGGALARYDTVILQLNLEERRGDIVLVQGDEGSTSEYVPADNLNSKEFVLARIYVGANATVISAGDIIDKRGDSSVCPWVRLTNVSGKLKTYRNNVTLAEKASTISIGITDFVAADDTLFVYKNGLLLEETEEYLINGTGSTATIDLASPAVSGTVFTFVIQKILI